MAADFSGRWVCVDIQGPTDSLMQKMGAKWIIRRLAAMGHYGKGKQVQEIHQEGDKLTIHTWLGPRNYEYTCTVGAGEQSLLTMSGQKNVATPSWQEGGVLFLPSSNYQGHTEKRWVEADGSMVLEQSMGSVTERRKFERRAHK